jgi:hypothetical protein
VGDVFGGALSGLEDATMLDALRFGGGSDVAGATRILLRAAVAALLNSTAGIGFPMSTAEILDAVETALNTEDRGTILDLADRLDELNNAGSCPLS